jgi:phosphopantothenoylcysteine decarboxylase
MDSIIQESRKVLYIITCAASPASRLDELVIQAQDKDWDVCVIATPQATKFIDVVKLETLTHHPVRSEYKQPNEQDVLPPADAVLVVPATFNTFNKWALGIADTLATGMLCEYLGRGLPIVAVPYLNPDLIKHPAFSKSMRILKKAGVHILFEQTIEGPIKKFSWENMLTELNAIPRENSIRTMKGKRISSTKKPRSVSV